MSDPGGFIGWWMCQQPQEKAQPESGEMGRRHGIDCAKAPHTSTGYGHAEDDDSPYDVDGVLYCGRCHTWIESPVRAPWEDKDTCAWCGGGNPAVCHKCMQKEIAVARTKAHCAGQQYGFQRGQKAMAEKAAQLADKWQNERAIDYEPNGVTEQGKGFEAGLRICAIELRGLIASVEPPQGEAEKEGRT